MKKRIFLTIILGLFFNLIYPQSVSTTAISEPEKVIAGNGTAPPSDAIVLFDGKDLAQWNIPPNTEWIVKNGVVTITPSKAKMEQPTYIVSKREFGDVQLHVEWRSPEKIDSIGQRRGNSGILLQGFYEVQVLDNYNNTTDPDRQCASIYNQYAPLVNVCRKPGEWQVYDIIFRAPRFRKGGNLESPAYITIIQNGVLVQDHVPVLGYIKSNKYIPHPLKMPLKLQDHGNAVSYRNIWIRDL